MKYAEFWIILIVSILVLGIVLCTVQPSKADSLEDLIIALREDQDEEEFFRSKPRDNRIIEREVIYIERAPEVSKKEYNSETARIIAEAPPLGFSDRRYQPKAEHRHHY